MGAYREPGLSGGIVSSEGSRCLFLPPGLARERGEQPSLVAAVQIGER